MKTQYFILNHRSLFKILLVVGLLFAFPQQTNAQFLKKLKEKAEKKIEREAEKRAERRINKKIDEKFDEAEEVLDGEKKKKKKKNTENESNSEENNIDFGAFSTMHPANGDVIAWPPFLDWEIDNESSYTFTVHLEGDDWSDWLTKTVSKKTNVGFTNLPTNTTNFKWQVIAEGNGQRLESPWQNFATSDGTNGDLSNTKKTSKPKKPTVSWSRFDFVPGDTVIFEDAPSADEENGEFPSRWDLKKGNAEIMSADGEHVICFPQGGTIIPYLKNSKDDYLPEIFTIEIDAYFRSGYSRRLYVNFYDVKNQKKLNYKTQLTLYVNSAEIDDSEASLPNKTGNKSENGGWRHISIAFTKGKLKVYINDTRLINIPHFEANPTGLTLEMDGYAADTPEDIQYIKNIRIAKGGVKYYERVLSEGKIIVNGIKFDVNKATLKPESMGPINKIYKLMQKQPELNFSVEGHTDSDGSDDTNMTLSKARGKSVMDKLIAMGISANRLKSNGFGESKPIDNNSTPEGKANNRRVEFVKF